MIDFLCKLLLIIFSIILIIMIGIIVCVYIETTEHRRYYDNAVKEIEEEENINNELNKK